MASDPQVIDYAAVIADLKTRRARSPSTRTCMSHGQPYRYRNAAASSAIYMTYASR